MEVSLLALGHRPFSCRRSCRRRFTRASPLPRMMRAPKPLLCSSSHVSSLSAVERLLRLAAAPATLPRCCPMLKPPPHPSPTAASPSSRARSRCPPLPRPGAVAHRHRLRDEREPERGMYTKSTEERGKKIRSKEKQREREKREKRNIHMFCLF
jgi:hypothetical protein